MGNKLANYESESQVLWTEKNGGGAAFREFQSARSNNQTFGQIDEKSNEDAASQNKFKTMISKRSKETSPSSFHENQKQFL